MSIIHFLRQNKSQNEIQVMQNRALRKISFKKLHDPTAQLYKDLKLLKFCDIFHLQNCLFMNQIEQLAKNLKNLKLEQLEKLAKSFPEFIYLFIYLIYLCINIFIYVFTFLCTHLFIYLFISFYFVYLAFLNALCSSIVVLTYLRSTLQVIFPYINYNVTSIYIDHFFVNHVKK